MVMTVALALSSTDLTAQPARPFSLSEALAEADRAAFPNRRAVATTEVERSRTAPSLKGILPSARIEAGFVRTTDPIGAFGTLLRQRRVTSVAFDPTRLNDPLPANNLLGGIVLELPVFNADALTGWQAARTATRASEAAADRVQHDVRFSVVRAYYGAVLAQEKVTVLLDAERAAHSAVQQVESMIRQGLVTRADALQSRVRAADVSMQLSMARHDAVTAAHQLALLLGRSFDARHAQDAQIIVLPHGLPSDSSILALLPGVETRAASSTTMPTVNQRDDLRAAKLGFDAARLDVRSATATLLPRVNGFARYDWHSPTTLYAGRPNWTLGIMASWSVFGGGNELVALAGARARARLAAAAHEAATAQAQLEVAQVERSLSVTREHLDLAAQAAAQSREALRLIDKRYASGLATVAELLGAENSAMAAALRHAAARYDLIVALAAHRHANGADPASLAQLDAAPMDTSSTIARE